MSLHLVAPRCTSLHLVAPRCTSLHLVAPRCTSASSHILPSSHSQLPWPRELRLHSAFVACRLWFFKCYAPAGIVHSLQARAARVRKAPIVSPHTPSQLPIPATLQLRRGVHGSHLYILRPLGMRSARDVYKRGVRFTPRARLLPPLLQARLVEEMAEVATRPSSTSAKNPTPKAHTETPAQSSCLSQHLAYTRLEHSKPPKPKRLNLADMGPPLPPGHPAPDPSGIRKGRSSRRHRAERGAGQRSGDCF